MSLSAGYTLEIYKVPGSICFTLFPAIRLSRGNSVDSALWSSLSVRFKSCNNYFFVFVCLSKEMKKYNYQIYNYGFKQSDHGCLLNLPCAYIILNMLGIQILFYLYYFPIDNR